MKSLQRIVSAKEWFLLPLVLSGYIVGVPASPGTAVAKATLAQDAGMSPVAGVSLPKGAARQMDASLSAGLGRLMADGAKEFKLPARAGGPTNAEVYFWTGAAYKPGRNPFMQTILQSALTGAGYSFYKVDSSYENTPNAFDEEKYATGPLNIAPFDGRHQYFHATNAKTGKTIVGVWIEQESKNRTVLALSEVGFAGAPTETKLPTLSGPDVWLVKDLKNASKGMPVPTMPTFAKLAPKPGVARGQVKDANGKPIAGARVVASSSAAGGFRTYHETRANAEGIYEITLPVGVSEIVEADCRVSYDGRGFTLPLQRVDGERESFSSRAGHVENFVLQTTGAGGGEDGGYGATMRVLVHNAPVGSTVEVTLAPDGPLLGGGKGKTLVFRYPIKTAYPETFFGGIPIGRYTLTAKVYEGEDVLPLQARKLFGDASGDGPKLAPSLPVKFEAANGKFVSSGKSGMRQFEVVLEP